MVRAYGGSVSSTDVSPEDSPEEWERPDRQVQATAAGSIMAAGLLGLRDVIEGRPEREEPAIVSEAPAAPPPDNIEVILDFEHPERSVVYVRQPTDDEAPDD